MPEDLLPSWRESSARAAVIDFLTVADQIKPERRLAVFDNDGTLWCEKPRYPQLDFFEWSLRRALTDSPELQSVPEFDAMLTGDSARIHQIGLEPLAESLLRLFAGWTPEQFESHVSTFFSEARHADTGLRFDRLVYQPMLELLNALETRGFTTGIVTGGGTEFVRAISRRLYGVEQERVVGTLVTYDLIQRNGRQTLARTTSVQGGVNEGPTKVSNIQVALGRTPVVAGGNSPGDADMLEHTNSLDGPSLALLVNHDDPEREYAYVSEAGSYEAAEPVTTTATRLGWTQVSMRSDWATIFPPS